MQEFGVGSVISDTLHKFVTRFPLHFGYALLPALVGAGVSYLATARATAAITSGAGPRLALYGSPLYWAALLIGLLCQGWAITGIVGSMLRLDGRGLTFGDMVSISIENIGKYLVLYLIWYVVIVIASILLVIPGLIVLSIWAAAIPAMVDGGLGPWQALGESGRLTKGRRLGVFATLVILLIVLAIPAIALFSTMGFDVISMVQQRRSQPLIFSAFSLLSSALFMVVLSAYFAALFSRLHGGVSPDLAETFA